MIEGGCGDNSFIVNCLVMRIERVFFDLVYFKVIVVVFSERVYFFRFDVNLSLYNL